MAAGFNDRLGVTLAGFREDRYWVELTAGEDHLHERGFVHGGVILSLLDIAMARVVRHCRGNRSYAPTMELATSFLRPLPPGLLRAWGMVCHDGRRLCRTEGAVLDGEGRICASARAAFMLADEPA